MNIEELRILIYFINESPVKLWGLTSPQRNMRILKSAGVTNIVKDLIVLPGNQSVLLLRGDYLFDDNVNLLGNKALDISSLDVTELQKAAFSARSGRLRRPVSMASFAVNRYFFGLDPYSYKLINLAIHLLTGL